MGDSFVVLMLEKPQSVTPEVTEILGEVKECLSAAVTKEGTAGHQLMAHRNWSRPWSTAKLQVAQSLLWAILQWPVDLTWFFSCCNYTGKHENTLIMFQEIHSTTCNGILVVTNESQLRSGKEEEEKGETLLRAYMSGTLSARLFRWSHLILALSFETGVIVLTQENSA